MAEGDPKVVTMILDRQVKKHGDKFHLVAYRLEKK